MSNSFVCAGCTYLTQTESSHRGVFLVVMISEIAEAAGARAGTGAYLPPEVVQGWMLAVCREALETRGELVVNLDTSSLHRLEWEPLNPTKYKGMECIYGDITPARITARRVGGFLDLWVFHRTALYGDKGDPVYHLVFTRASMERVGVCTTIRELESALYGLEICGRC